MMAVFALRILRESTIHLIAEKDYFFFFFLKRTTSLFHFLDILIFIQIDRIPNGLAGSSINVAKKN